MAWLEVSLCHFLAGTASARLLHLPSENQTTSLQGGVRRVNTCQASGLARCLAPSKQSESENHPSLTNKCTRGRAGATWTSCPAARKAALTRNLPLTLACCPSTIPGKTATPSFLKHFLNIPLLDTHFGFLPLFLCCLVFFFSSQP